MIEYQQKMECFKSDVLSLCINSNKQFDKFKEYFPFLKERLHYYFGMEDCLLFKVEGKQLKALNNEMNPLLMETQLTLTMFEYEFKNQKIAKLPSHLKELNYLKKHTDVMALEIDGQIEGTSGAIFKMLKEALFANTKAKIGAALIKNNLKSIKDKMDYSEYGGAALFGLKAPVIKAHGSSNPRAIYSAIRQANMMVEHKVCETITETIAKLPKAE